MGWYILCDYRPSSHNAMCTDSDARQYHSVSTNPYIVIYHHGFRTDALFVNPFGSVLKIVIQGCHCDALCQVDVIADAYWSYYRTMNTYARVVANGYITHRIVDATI